jgi:hypothetical protein
MLAFGPTFSASSGDSKNRNQRLHTLPGDAAGQGGTVAVVDDFLDAREVTGQRGLTGLMGLTGLTD